MNGVLLVTGGSRGIGAAVATLAAQRGFDVAVNYREDERAASAIVEAVRSSGVRALALKGDVSVEADVVRMFEAVDTFGPLKALINNAGVTGGFSRVADLKGPALERTFAVNVIGAMLCAREAVRRLSTVWGGDGGSIVNVSSLAAKLGGGGEWVHYAASKGAINTITVGLAREVAAEGVRVNARRGRHRRHRDAPGSRRPAPRETDRRHRTDRPRRDPARNRRGDPLAHLARRIVHHRDDPRSRRRPLSRL